MEDIVVVFISILISLPISILLLIWMLQIKKNNPFPRYSVVKMLIGGAVAMIIAAVLGTLINVGGAVIRLGPTAFLDMIKNLQLGNIAAISQYAQVKPSFWRSFLRAFFHAFIIAALFEELAKYIVMRLCLRKPGALTNRLDAMICGAIVGLGFQIVEDILYANGSILSAIMRALTPYHFIFGLIMGYFFGKAMENGQQSNHAKALLLPVLIHGLYDVSTELINVHDLFVIFFVVVAVGMIVLSIILLLRLKKWGKDNPFPPIKIV